MTALPQLLRRDETIAELAGAATALLAVPDPARAFVIAGLAHLSGRHPFLVVTPTSADADRIAHDLRAFLGDDEVDLFPAWETLPFERVSPSVETMGRRLRLMWRLRTGAPPRIVVAPVKANVPGETAETSPVPRAASEATCTTPLCTTVPPL